MVFEDITIKLRFPDLQLNRTILTTLYVGIVVFSTLLGLKQMTIAGPLFLFSMFPMTLYVDRAIRKTFVVPSDTLALTKARAIDEENLRKEFKRQRRAKIKRDNNEASILNEANSFHREDSGFGSGSGALSTSATSMISSGDGTTNAGKSKVNPGESAITEVELVQDSSTQFRVVREDTADAIKSRLKKNLGAANYESKFGKTSLHQIFSTKDDDEAGQDYFIYRQPDLNKSTWETKPRPYR